jgi:hypothetical protein
LKKLYLKEKEQKGKRNFKIPPPEGKARKQRGLVYVWWKVTFSSRNDGALNKRYEIQSLIFLKRRDESQE